jgi:hypothetical protein
VLRSDPKCSRKVKPGSSKIYAKTTKGKMMAVTIDIEEINARIQLLKKTAEDLNRIGEDFPALTRNIVRIMASIKMLEINVSDIVDLH